MGLVFAAIYGRYAHQANVEGYLPGSLPHAVRFHPIHTGSSEKPLLFSARDESDHPLGYVTVSKGNGFGGPMLVVLGWSPEGKIQSIRVPKHGEDAPWYRLLENKKYLEQYLGRGDTDPLRHGKDVDGVTGATRSAEGIAEAVLKARESVAGRLGHKVDPVPAKPVQFIYWEAFLLLGLALAVLFRSSRPFSAFRWRRGVTLVFGFLLLGLWIQQPLSFVDFAVWMVGYAPPWRSHFLLYVFFYLVIAFVLIQGRNFYCFWLCPFSAVQEGAHLLTGTPVRPGKGCSGRLEHTRFVLLWLALFLALLFRNPSIAIYEPWATLFTLKGLSEQWILVVLAVGSAMVIRNFWCRYLCPVGAVLELARRLHHRVSAVLKRTHKA
jgi:NosR/NirI family transcriptional regulator, nitrous oxide reductase regulator